MRHLDGSDWAGALVTFKLRVDAWTADSVYPLNDVYAVTESDGTFSAVLTADLTTPYKCILPDKRDFSFYLPAGAPISIETLHATASTPPADISTSDFLTRTEALTLFAPIGISGVTAHSQLTGLDADDHPQYLTRTDAATAYVSYADLANESSNRQSEDIVLVGQLTAEQVARAAADSTLAGGTSTEASTRTTADTGLQAQITALLARVTALENADPPPATYTLSLSADSGGTTAVNAPGPYTAGTSVTVTPTPDSTHSFNNWTLDGAGSSDNPLVVVMNGNHTLVAHWTALPAPIAKTRVYADDSPWNTPIGGSPALYAGSSAAVAAMVDTSFVGDNNFQTNAGIGLHFTSDPTQFAFPTYWIDPDVTGTKSVHYSGLFSDVRSSGVEHKYNGGGTVSAPFPVEATPSPGSDGSFVVVDLTTGDIWGGWQLQNIGGGASFSCTNLYCLRAGMDGTGVQPVGFTSRGPGMGYEGGTIYAHEMIAALGTSNGDLGHALGFAYDIVTPKWVEQAGGGFATKSDGIYSTPGLPEGVRLQFDPAITEADFRARYATLHGAGGVSLTEDEIQMALVILRTGQVYGLVMVDHSGQRPGKIIPGGQETELWGVGSVPAYTSHVVWYLNPAWLRVLAFTDTNGLAADTTTGTVQWLDHYTAEQTFNSATGGAFVRAEVGGNYSLNSADKTLFGATSGEAWVNCAVANAGRGWQLLSVAARDVRSTHFWRPVGLPVGAPHEAYVQLRVGSDTHTYYQLRCRVNVDGTLRLTLQAVVAGSTTALNTEFNTGVVYNDLTKRIGVTMEATGSSPTTVRARVWIATTPDETDAAQPSTWQVSVSDSTAALQVAGGSGLQYSLASGSTAAPQRFYTTFWRGVAL